MRLILLLIFALFIITLVFYLSWLPQPKLGQVWIIPDWVASWTDTNSNADIRTGVPFVFLGILTGAWLLLINYPWYGWLMSWLGLIGVVIIAEFGQVFLPYRSFSWWDIGWGATGAIVGLAGPFTYTTLGNFLKALIRRHSGFKLRF